MQFDEAPVRFEGAVWLEGAGRRRNHIDVLPNQCSDELKALGIDFEAEVRRQNEHVRFSPLDFGVLLQGAFTTIQQEGRLPENVAAISRHPHEA